MSVPYSVFYKDGRAASKRLKTLLGDKVFENPKDEEILKRLIEFCGTGKDDLVVDFFSGSGTTAHALFLAEAEKPLGRRFVLVQLPEVIDPNTGSSEKVKKIARNAVAFLDSIHAKHTISEIAKERIRRAGKNILEGNPTTAPNLDIGFRVLKLDSSSLNDTSATVGETTQTFENFDRIKSDRSPEDLLFQMLLETRIPLSDPIEMKKVGGNNVFFVSDKALLACLDPAAKMTTEFFLEIAKIKPGLAFFRDDAFADDSARTNLQQAFDQFSPSTSIKVI